MDRALLYSAVLAIALFPMLTAGDVGSCNCLDISLENRSPCGSPGIPFEICKAAGCCYDPRYSGGPTCYTNQLVTNQQQLEKEQKLKEQQKLEELCRKCNEGLIKGVLGAIFGSNRSPDCNKCKS
ncbi:trefoil factor 1-like [Bufo bufo]|uniref:trefoil factor 1-like n=1 Tax=Bufo bufo TaxID=8384 RepID=UPI001ABEC24E|nr:trefoil factor 1-like [Bufo bufo]